MTDDGDTDAEPVDSARPGGAGRRPTGRPGDARLSAIRWRLGKVARIARWEVSHTAGGFDRRTAVLGLVTLLLAGGVAAAAAAAGGGGSVALDQDLYRVAVPADSPYREPVEAAPSLDPVPPGHAWDVRVVDQDVTDREARVLVADSRKGEAALAAFRAAVQAGNDRLMAAESNQSAAFPVVVTLGYQERDAVGVGGGAGGDGGGNVTSGDGDGDGDGAGIGGGGLGGTGGTGDGDGTSGGDGGPLGLPDVGTGGLFGDSQSGSPADIQPPFPFSSLVLAFAFLVPMNFVVQAYGSTVLDERINRRGELLLVSPVAPADIVAGKTLPYLGVAVAVTVLVALAVGGGVVSVLAVVPIALLFLAATFVGGMFARSFKELTFVTVAVSVFLTTYAFVPAIFANVTPIALISPLTLVVRDLQGAGVAAGEYLFSTGPFYLSAGVLFLLGLGVYREEDMFTQRAVPLKFLDALDARLSTRGSVAVLSALFIPFVFVAELLAVALLFALPFALSFPLLLLAVAVVEEVAKSVHVYAGFAKARFEPNLRTGLLLGGLSGLGFFVGEKLTVVVQLVGLPDLFLGRAAFGTGAVAGPAAVGLLLAPLALHVVTAVTSSLGASRGRSAYGLALGLAILIHTVYNLLVVSALG